MTDDLQNVLIPSDSRGSHRYLRETQEALGGARNGGFLGKNRSENKCKDGKERLQEQVLGDEWYLCYVTLRSLGASAGPEWAMYPFPYLAATPVDTPKNSTVYQMKAHLLNWGTSDQGTVEYLLIEGGEDRFEVDKNTGAIRTTGLPLQKNKEYVLTVQAADRQGNKGSYASIYVLVGSRPPQFSSSSYSVSVPENTPPGQIIAMAKAISFQKKVLSYTLLINPSSLFTINQDSGELSLTHSMDYESEHHLYHLLVKVAEAGTGLSSVAEVMIQITDENDCTPEFLQSIYTRDNIPETIPISTSLLQVLAKDCDSGSNAEISYSIQSSDFSITPQGVISPKKQLDYERANHIYEFAVVAVDNGHPPRTGMASVRIRMTNVNDEAPVFSQNVYKTFLSEDAGPNTLVAIVHAKDPDGDSVSYKINGGNEEGNFEMDSHNGIIRLRKIPLPSLHGPQYILNITATDDNSSGGPRPLSRSAQVIVGINDINNNKPVFKECTKYSENTWVLENQPPGTVVLQVEASDADLGLNGEIKYGIMHREGVTPGFTIHPETGVITTTQSFDREKQREYTVSVTATDQAQEPLIGVCQITVYIADVNDNDPKFENSRYQYFLREDTAVGTSFLRAAAHDDDQGTNAIVTYSLSSQQPAYLQIHPSTGWIYVNHPISQTSRIGQNIIATDGGNRSSSVELTVTITNVYNQPPQWDKAEYYVIIAENTIRDSKVVTIKATSPLGDPRVTYNLEEGQVPETNMPVRFYLKPNRGDGSASILVAEPLDFETTNFFTLRVRAENVAAVPLASFTTVFINITDVNDNVPFFTSSIYEATIPEGADHGTAVVQVSATDQDSGLHGKVHYLILKDPSHDHQFFSINQETGMVYTRTSFDRERKGSYLIEVQSQDSSESARPGMNGQYNSDTAYVRVFVSDVNDNAPVFPLATYESSVEEGKDVGSVVLTVTANDEDEGANAKLRYQITSGNVKGAFDIEPEVGTIVIAQQLNYEEVQRYELGLVASDGKWENQTTVIINVINKNDEAPVFSRSEYHTSVLEELHDLPAFISQVTATDPDQEADQSAVRYSLHGQGSNTEFTIDELTGMIYVQKKLDREERSAWRFLVLATDENGEGLTGFADVIVDVVDVNDNSPMFLCVSDGCFTGYVSEDSPADTSVMEITAVDLDDPKTGKNAIITYQIIQNVRNEINLNLFSINPSTGTIYTVLGSLDRERQEKYLVVVEAKDGGGLTGTGTATVVVLDVNDHGPIFAQDLFITSLPENAEINSEVLAISVSDADAGENAMVTFSIVAGDENRKFFIETDKTGRHGLIRLKKKIDFEKPHERRFNLTIKAEDIDFSSLAYCIVEVEDCNDHAPVFFPQFYESSVVLEDVPLGTKVIQVTAVDLDSSQNGMLSYSIAPESDPQGQFTVDNSGWVKVAGALDRELLPEHHLNVLATDMGSPSLTGSTAVLVILQDINDNGPEFEMQYSPIVWENTNAPQLVWINETSSLMYAKDRDTTANGPPFSFQMLLDAEHNANFVLTDFGNGSASLTALHVFDREEHKFFHLSVIITDSGDPPMTSTCTLTVSVGDKNDHPHSSGHTEFIVYSYKGILPTTVLGKVHAPDRDEWDEKKYHIVGKLSRHFILNKTSGEFTIKEGITPGIYHFKVRVSDGIWPDVVSTVKITVHCMGEEAISNAGSIRMENITAEEFLSQPPDGDNKYTKLRKLLSEVIPAQPEHVHIFSIGNGKGRVREMKVWYAAHGSPYYKADKLNGNVAAHKTRIEAILGVNITQISIDDCMNVDCRHTAGCWSSTSFDHVPTIITAGSVSMVSLTASTNTQCYCRAREDQHLPCSSYSTNPCLNGGTCIDSDYGYRCRCPPLFEGPECQQTKHTFRGGGYAWFPPLKPCFESRISLEFITEVPNGLLFYNGPMTKMQFGDSEDFIALELKNGVPSLKLNQGSGSLLLQLPPTVNAADRRWHRIDIKNNGKVVYLTLDHCSAASMKESEGNKAGWNEFNRLMCEVSGRTPGNERFLNVYQPLQLGGVKEIQAHHDSKLFFEGFVGCIRNLAIDSMIYDLGSPAESLNGAPGCALTDEVCQSTGKLSCGENGACLGEWGSFSCDCHPGYAGHNCEKALPEWSFEKDSLIQYQLTGSLNPSTVRAQLMVRTRAPFGTLLSMTAKERREYILLEVVDGHFGVRFNLGDGEQSLRLRTVRVDNGIWVPLSMELYSNELTLRLDNGGGDREVTSTLSTHRQPAIDLSSMALGNNLPDRSQTDFQGCMRDVRVNGHLLFMDEKNTEFAAIVDQRGITPGCQSDACNMKPCHSPFLCVDLWRKYECRCPAGTVAAVEELTSQKHCAPSPCGQWSCRNRGTCVALSPEKFVCHCMEGFRGQWCEMSQVKALKNAGLSSSSILAISMCLLVFLALLVAFTVWSQWGRAKFQKGGVYHIPVEHESWEDIRENVLNYDEEGGGEQDQNGYDISELKRPLHASLSQSSSGTTAPLLKSSPSSEVETLSPLKEPPPPPEAAPSSSLDYKAYVSRIIWEADNDPQAFPLDSIHTYCLEGLGSLAGSLSSLDSSSLDEDLNYDYLRDWGSKFDKLRELYISTDDEMEQKS
ncbi:neural-cadherin-like [Protopterus annectens]|uniref:neural-cadherin-like n=1 Tax=Protopterus annectens TaxID=7888 RepID=UPI001CFA5A4B|nr:neural-cadherin-like [Protopterus annectens]